MDEIEGLDGSGIGRHVMAADLEGAAGRRKRAEIEISGEHATCGPDCLEKAADQPPTSGPDLPARPPLGNAHRLEYRHRPRIEELAEQHMATSDWVGRASEEVVRR